MVASRFWKDEEGRDSVWLDPDDREDFAIDCTRKLPVGASLLTATAESEEGGITVSGLVIDGNRVSFFLEKLTGDMAEVTVKFFYDNGGERSWTIRAYRREG